MKYIAPIAAILAMVLGTFSTEIQSLVVAHPALSIVFSALSALVAAFMPQPHKA